MVAVSSASDPARIAYCLDQYEVVVEGNLGSKDQLAEDAIPSTSIALPLPERIPTTAVSYDQAVATCANTPVVTSWGELVGHKRMATSAEWIDAYDGVLGSGGTCYPYGDVFDETACATLTAEGQQQYFSLQPTASLARCRSGFGAFDLAGNAWEWADSGVTLDIDGYFSFAESNGITLVVSDDGFLMTETQEATMHLEYQIAGVEDTVYLDANGYLAQKDASVNPQVPLKGYLKLSDRGAWESPENFLPIQLRLAEGASEDYPYRAFLLTGEDGAPVPDKLGMAYYVGDSQICGADSSQLAHFHDFDGTINFRCVCDPIPSAPSVTPTPTPTGTPLPEL